MNLILFTADELNAGAQLTLSDHRFTQIHSVHRSQLGDTVKVGEINGLIGTGTITFIDDQQVKLSVCLTDPPPQKIPLTIILALPRPKMIRRIFRTIAELGAERLIIINSYKVEKSFWQSPAITKDKVRTYLTDGLQQSKDTQLPAIEFHKRFKPFVEDELTAIIDGKKALLAHPNTGEACPHQLDQPLCLAIGPEGGFTEYEAEKLQSIGFNGIHLGPRILKVENALTTLVAKLYS